MYRIIWKALIRVVLLSFVFILPSFAGEGFISGSWRFDLDANLQKLKKLGAPYYIFSVQDSLLSFNVAGDALLKDRFKYITNDIGGEHYLKIHESRFRYANLFRSFSLEWKNTLFGLELGKHSESQNVQLNNYSWEEYVFPSDSIADPKYSVVKEKKFIKSNFVQGKLLYTLPKLIDNLQIRAGLTYRMLSYEKRDSLHILNSTGGLFNFLGTLRYDTDNIHGYIIAHDDIRSYITAITSVSERVIAFHYDNILQSYIRLFYFHGSSPSLVEEQVMMRQNRLYKAMLLNTQSDLVEQAMYDYPLFLRDGWYVSITDIKNQKNPEFEFGTFLGGFIGLHARHGDKQTSFSILFPVGSLTFADVNNKTAIVGSMFFRW